MKIKKQININRFLPGVQKNISLKNYTTFRIGGRAKYFFTAKTKEDLIRAVAMAKKLKLPFFILGGGSNLLVSDKGYKGLIIKFQNPNSKIQIPKSKFQNPKIYVEAGAMLRELLNATAKAGLSGLEWAAGIPGTVGGAVYGNCGAFGKSIADIVESVEVLDVNKIPNFEIQTKILRNHNCRFGYRESIFKRNKNLIILSANIKLKKGKKKEIQKKIKECLNYRKRHQPLNYPSVGSVFKNPKGFSAGELGEKCGLKGKRIGRAKISEKHANFIVNLGGGKAKNVMRLINLVKKKVKKKFKINLEEEIQHLPER